MCMCAHVIHLCVCTVEKVLSSGLPTKHPPLHLLVSPRERQRFVNVHAVTFLSETEKKRGPGEKSVA